MSEIVPGIEKDKYRPDIDGLRAVAVMSVVLFHVFPKVLRGGYVGVDIFFVISGFLISSILFAEFSAGRFSLAAFYGRRIRRIFPALGLVMALVLGYGFVVLMPVELARLGKHVLFGAGFLSNIALWSESGYFDTTAASKPLLHLWSLGVEEQFYILWPAALWLAHRFRTNMLGLVAAVFALSFAANVVMAGVNISDDFYLPVSRFWELLAGAALAWAATPNFRPTAEKLLLRWPILGSRRLADVLSVMGLAALATSILLFGSTTRFPGWPALLPVLGSVALIQAGPGAVVNRFLLSLKPVVFVGLISYPVYIWHWPLVSYAHIIRIGRAPTPLMGAGIITACLILAWMTYQLIERPLRFGRHRRAKTLLLAAWMCLLGGLGAAVWSSGGLPGRFPAMPNFDMAKISAAAADPIFRATDSMAVTNIDQTLVTHIGQGSPKILLTGDSTLFHYGPRVERLHAEGRLEGEVIFVSGASCAPLPGVLLTDQFTHCRDMPDIIAKTIEQNGVGTLVIGASWPTETGGHAAIVRNGQQFMMDTPEGVQAYWSNLEDWVRHWRDKGLEVYLIRLLPMSDSFNTTKFVSRGLTGFSFGDKVDRGVPVVKLAETRKWSDAPLAAIAAHTGAQLLDPFPDVCGDGEECSAFFGEQEPKFVDGMHLRPVFVAEHIHFLDPILTGRNYGSTAK